MRSAAPHRLVIVAVVLAASLLATALAAAGVPIGKTIERPLAKLGILSSDRGAKSDEAPASSRRSDEGSGPELAPHVPLAAGSDSPSQRRAPEGEEPATQAPDRPSSPPARPPAPAEQPGGAEAGDPTTTPSDGDEENGGVDESEASDGSSFDDTIDEFVAPGEDPLEVYPGGPDPAAAGSPAYD